MTRIPRVLWTYWHTAELPPLVQECITSWKKNLSDFPTVHVLHADHELVQGLVRKAPPNMYPPKSSHFSDWLRLTVVERWGGVWMDASILVNNGKQIRDLVSATEQGNYEVGGYHLTGFQTLPEFPILESWWFCAPSSSPFITSWKREFDRAISIGFQEYRVAIAEEGIDAQNIYITSGTYLTIHACAQAVMQRRAHSSQRFPATYMITGDAIQNGPFQMHKDAFWNDSVLGLFMLTKQYDKYPIVKVRGSERTAHIRFLLRFLVAMILCLAILYVGY